MLVTQQKINLGAFLICALCAATTAHALQPGESNLHEHNNLTDAELNAAIAALDHPDTQVAAISTLVGFSRGIIFQTGSLIFMEADPERDRREHRAVDALKKYETPETFRRIADSQDQLATLWALFFFHQLLHDRYSETQQFLPVLRKLATGEVAQLRGASQEDLAMLGTENEFLTALESTETNPSNLLHLIYDIDRDHFQQLMNVELLRLLNSPDAEIQNSALGFISWNWNAAPFWQVQFNKDILEKSLALAASGTNRPRAAQAVASMRSLDPARIDPVLARLALDQDVEVRRNVTLAIFTVHADQVNNLPESNPTDPAIRRLLEVFHHDSDPEIRYFAILGLNPPSKIAELEQLAMCTDTFAATMAISQLTAIAQTYKSAHPLSSP